MAAEMQRAEESRSGRGIFMAKWRRASRGPSLPVSFKDPPHFGFGFPLSE